MKENQGARPVVACDVDPAAHALLRLGPLPQRGDNAVQVDLTRHDPRADPSVLLNDVELIVQYRDHRHAPRRDEWWDGQRQR